MPAKDSIDKNLWRILAIRGQARSYNQSNILESIKATDGWSLPCTRLGSIETELRKIRTDRLQGRLLHFQWPAEQQDRDRRDADH